MSLREQSLGCQLRHPQKFPLDRDDQIAKHPFIELQILFERTDQGRLSGELVEHIVALPALFQTGRGIRQLTYPPAVDVGHLGAVRREVVFISFHHLVEIVFADLRIENADEFVFVHLHLLGLKPVPEA